jgi:hypothetical protein
MLEMRGQYVPSPIHKSIPIRKNVTAQPRASNAFKMVLKSILEAKMCGLELTIANSVASLNKYELKKPREADSEAAL